MYVQPVRLNAKNKTILCYIYLVLLSLLATYDLVVVMGYYTYFDIIIIESYD